MTQRCMMFGAVWLWLTCGLVQYGVAEEVRVYRCEHPQGLVEYSDRFCGNSATLQRLSVLPSGMQLGPTGDYSAVEQGNRMRTRRRGLAKTRRLLAALVKDYNEEREALERSIDKLPRNALRKANERDIAVALDALKRDYLKEKTLLSTQLEHFGSISTQQ